jgi:hypothetical protein
MGLAKAMCMNEKGVYSPSKLVCRPVTLNQDRMFYIE